MRAFSRFTLVALAAVALVGLTANTSQAQVYNRWPLAYRYPVRPPIVLGSSVGLPTYLTNASFYGPYLANQLTTVQPYAIRSIAFGRYNTLPVTTYGLAYSTGTTVYTPYGPYTTGFSTTIPRGTFSNVPGIPFNPYLR